MSTRLNLQGIIDAQALDPKILAAELFPGVEHTVRALQRVLNGKAFLNSEQISKLAFLTGLTFDEIFSATEWSLKSEEDLIILETGDYRAVINTASWLLKLSKKGSLFHESVLVSQAVKLSELLKFLNNLITVENGI